MNIEFATTWPLLVMAVLLIGDVILSIKPADFIDECLTGVRFPEEYRWTLLVVKSLAGLGFLVGVWVPLIGIVTAVCTVMYFLCGIIAHVRSGYLPNMAWYSCLTMFACAAFTLVFVGYVRWPEIMTL